MNSTEELFSPEKLTANTTYSIKFSMTRTTCKYNRLERHACTMHLIIAWKQTWRKDKAKTKMKTHTHAQGGPDIMRKKIKGLSVKLVTKL